MNVTRPFTNNNVKRSINAILPALLAGQISAMTAPEISSSSTLNGCSGSDCGRELESVLYDNEEGFFDKSGFEILLTSFFVLAAVWSIFAVVYIAITCLVIKLRSQGRLEDDIYEENFGRYQLFGGAVYIPLGWIIRRYVVALGYHNNHRASNNQNARSNGFAPSHSYHFITRQERRIAVEALLLGHLNNSSKDVVVDNQPKKQQSTMMTKEDVNSNGDSTAEIDARSTSEGEGDNCHSVNVDLEAADDAQVESNESTGKEKSVAKRAEIVNVYDDYQTTEEPFCCICLEKYGDNASNNDNTIYSSQVCPHRFHTACILEWLERRSNTECPCCREPLLTDAQVWQQVRQQRRKNKSSSWLVGWQTTTECVEERQPSPLPPIISTHETATDSNNSNFDTSSENLSTDSSSIPEETV